MGSSLINFIPMSQVRNRNMSNYSQGGKGSLIQLKLIQTLETDRVKGQEQTEPNQKCCKSSSQQFIPFLKERDSMNRLVPLSELPSPELKLKKIQNLQEPKTTIVAKAQWKQVAPLRLISPLKRQAPNHNRLSTLETQLAKQRSQSNAEYRTKLLQAYTERQHHGNDDSIQQYYGVEDQVMVQAKAQKHEEEVQQSKSPAKSQRISVNNKDFVRERLDRNSYKVTRQQEVVSLATERENPIQLRLPLLKQKQYEKEFLEQNEQLKNWVTNQKEQAVFSFPSDFEQRLIQMKRLVDFLRSRSIKTMKARLKNWNNGMDPEENARYLREVADTILRKQS